MNISLETPPGTVWVGKNDQALMCGVNKGIALDTMAAQLEVANIKILETKKLHDNRMRIMSCGTNRGDINGFLISKEDLSKATELEFEVIAQ